MNISKAQFNVTMVIQTGMFTSDMSKVYELAMQCAFSGKYALEPVNVAIVSSGPTTRNHRLLMSSHAFNVVSNVIYVYPAGSAVQLKYYYSNLTAEFQKYLDNNVFLKLFNYYCLTTKSCSGLNITFPTTVIYSDPQEYTPPTTTTTSAPFARSQRNSNAASGVALVYIVTFIGSFVCCLVTALVLLYVLRISKKESLTDIRIHDLMLLMKGSTEKEDSPIFDFTMNEVYSNDHSNFSKHFFNLNDEVKPAEGDREMEDYRMSITDTRNRWSGNHKSPTDRNSIGQNGVLDKSDNDRITRRTSSYGSTRGDNSDEKSDEGKRFNILSNNRQSLILNPKRSALTSSEKKTSLLTNSRANSNNSQSISTPGSNESRGDGD